MRRAPPGGKQVRIVLTCIFLLSSSSVSACRSSRTVPQPDVVPQSRPRSYIHPSDRFSQRPLHSAMGQEETLHPGPLRGDADGRGFVSQWIADRQVLLDNL